MRASHLVAALIAGVLVGGGIWIGATVFRGDTSSEPTPEAAPRPDPLPSTPAPPPMLGRPDEAALARRLAALERRLGLLEATVADGAKELEPMMRLYEQAKASGMIADDGTPVGPTLGADEDFTDMGAGDARQLAKKLGLDARQSKAMADAASSIIDRLKELEKEHATVTVEGNTTTITIAPYNADTIKRDWEDWIARNLTPEQQDRMQREHGTNQLMGNRLGERAREITIKETGGMIDILESSGSAGDVHPGLQMQGPAAARDLMLEPYAHLLP